MIEDVANTKTRNRLSDTYIDVKGYMKNDILKQLKTVVFLSNIQFPNKRGQSDNRQDCALLVPIFYIFPLKYLPWSLFT